MSLKKTVQQQHKKQEDRRRRNSSKNTTLKCEICLMRCNCLLVTITKYFSFYFANSRKLMFWQFQFKLKCRVLIRVFVCDEIQLVELRWEIYMFGVRLEIIGWKFLIIRLSLSAIGEKFCLNFHLIQIFERFFPFSLRFLVNLLKLEYEEMKSQVNHGRRNLWGSLNSKP